MIFHLPLPLNEVRVSGLVDELLVLGRPRPVSEFQLAHREELLRSAPDSAELARRWKPFFREGGSLEDFVDLWLSSPDRVLRLARAREAGVDVALVLRNYFEAIRFVAFLDEFDRAARS